MAPNRPPPKAAPAAADHDDVDVGDGLSDSGSTIVDRTGRVQILYDDGDSWLSQAAQRTFGQQRIDVTVITTEGLSTGQRTRDQNEHRADTDKQRKYSAEALRQEASYDTLAFDVHGSLSQKGFAVLKRLASLVELKASDIIRQATHALQLGNGEILANARAAKANKLREKTCPLAALRAAAPEYRPRCPDDEIEAAIAAERRAQQLLSRAALAPGDEEDTDDYALPRLRVAFPSLPAWRPDRRQAAALA